jgi:probable rRNA maturation factor
MIEVEIEDPAWTAALPEAEALAMGAAEAALHAVHPPGDGSLAGMSGLVVLLTDDDTLADLNQRFRGKPGPTNVLSFPAPEAARPHLGDIAIAFGVCEREALQHGKRLEHHLIHLVAHGVLHLVGYDHQNESEAEEMEALERRVLEGLGAPDPYAAGAAGEGHAR